MKYSLAYLLVASALAGSSHAAVKVMEPVMVSIKPGRFVMGNDAPEGAAGEHNPGEAPAHPVQIKAFSLSKYEVTVGQFRQFIEATGYKPADRCWRAANNEWGIESVPGSWKDASVAQSEFHPVACVSWDDANAYIKWLSAQSGKAYRLPSESEWEYAATAGSSEKTLSAANPAAVCRLANLSDRRGKAALTRDLGIPDNGRGATCDDMAEYSTVVGMYEANPSGLHDMSGNISEWVADCQRKDYTGAPADGSAWTSNCDTAQGDMFVRRGGDFRYSPRGLRYASRAHGGQSNASYTDGFRVAMDGAASTMGGAAFAAELAKAQQAERGRRAAAK